LTLPVFFALLGGLLVLAFVANRLSRWTRVPDVIVLLGTGIVLGPVLHWIDVVRFGPVTQGFGTLALILILFAAGLELDLRHAIKQFWGAMVLSLLSYGLTLAGITYFCIYALKMARMPALLVAAPLACISGSIVLPVLDQLDLRKTLKTILIVEASFGDGIGALGVGVLLDVASGNGRTSSGALAVILKHIGLSPETRGAIAGGVAALLLFKFLLALALAVLAGFLWVRLLPVISDKQYWQVLTFAAVLLLYSGVHALGGSELFAVMAFGATLANMPDPLNRRSEFGFARLAPDPSRQIHSFHSELAFLVRSFFFVLLGAIIEFGGLRRQLVPSLGILGVLFLARAIAVQLSRVAWRGATAREREFAVLMIPRGLITAVLALEVVEARPNAFAFLPSLAFAVILFTNIFVLLAAIRAHHIAPDSIPLTAEAAAPSAGSVNRGAGNI
jgi:cell volume regulation protein A